MYNIYVHDKVRVLGIQRSQNQKLCNLYSLIINEWSITIGKVKILDNQGDFQWVKNWKMLNLISMLNFTSLLLIIRYVKYFQKVTAELKCEY